MVLPLGMPISRTVKGSRRGILTCTPKCGTQFRSREDQWHEIPFATQVAPASPSTGLDLVSTRPNHGQALIREIFRHVSPTIVSVEDTEDPPFTRQHTGLAAHLSSRRDRGDACRYSTVRPLIVQAPGEEQCSIQPGAGPTGKSRAQFSRFQSRATHGCTRFSILPCIVKLALIA